MRIKGKDTSAEMRKLIMKLRAEGNSLQQIAETVSKSRSTIQTIIRNVNINGSVASKPRTGRPRKFDNVETRNIVRKVKVDPKISANKILKEVNISTGKTCHRTTITRMLNRAGYRSRIARRKPFINKINARKRLIFAKNHEKYSENFWSSVIFSDESKFNIHGNDSRTRVWRTPNSELEKRNMVGTVKHGGGSVMVWGCMSASGTGNLEFIETTMNRFGYLNILKNNLRNSAQKLGLEGSFIFQHDNDPKHTSMVVKEWLLYNVPKQLKPPPQSPDMNPIEHLWDELEKRIRGHNINNKEELKQALQIEWAKIEPTTTKKLVDSMPRRMAAVIKSKGGPTLY